MWKKVSNSNEVKPQNTEYSEADRLWYVRKNFEQKENGEGHIYWEYDENILKEEEIENFRDLEKNSSLISYVAMMTDVDLPEEA